MKRVPSLDGFRAISIILVIIAHCRFSRGFPFQSQVQKSVQIGTLGVTIFFVISGFLITTLLLVEELKNEKINVKFFYARRFFRIVPVYVLYISVLLLFKNTGHLIITRNNLVHLVTFTSNFDKSAPAVFQHLWSLSVEEQFYLIWPAVFIVFKKHLKFAVLIFLLLSCFSRVLSYKFPADGVLILSQFLNFSDSIFIGALGGIIFFENQDICKLKIFNSYIFQIIAVIFISLFKYFPLYGQFGLIALPFGTSIVSISILFLIFCYLTPSDKAIFRLLNSRVIVHIGILSYSIYIWQQFFLLGKDAAWRTFPYNLLEVYVISLASYYLWEKPFLKLKRSFSTKNLHPAIVTTTSNNLVDTNFH